MEIWRSDNDIKWESDESVEYAFFLIKQRERGIVPFTNLVMFIYGVEDDQCRVPGDLKLGVGDRCTVVDHHHDVFRLRTYRRHIHRPAATQTCTSTSDTCFYCSVNYVHPQPTTNTYCESVPTLKINIIQRLTSDLGELTVETHSFLWARENGNQSHNIFPLSQFLFVQSARS